MPDTQLTNAVAFPQDAGTGNSGTADYASAAYFSMLAKHVGGEYVGDGLAFENVDTGANQVDITAGYAFIVDDVSINSADRTTTPTIQTTSATFDTTLPSNSDMPYVVVLPSDEVDFTLQNGNNDVYLYIDVTQQNDVYIRYGTGVTNPENDGTPKPALQLGTVDTTNETTTRTADGGGQFSARELNGSLTGNVALTDLAGANLNIAGGSLNATTNNNNDLLKSHSWINITNEDPTLGEVSRQFADNGDGSTIYVDVEGTVNGSGKITNPVKTLTKGCERIPLENIGSGALYVAPGNYTDENDDIYVPFLRGNTNATKFYITQLGDDNSQNLPAGDPSDYAISSHVHLGGLGSTKNFGIKGLEMDGFSGSGFCSVLKCNANPAAGENYSMQFRGAHSYVENCSIGTGASTSTYGLSVKDCSRVALQNCDIDGDTDAINIAGGCYVTMDSTCTLSGNAVGGMSDAAILADVNMVTGSLLVVDNRVYVGGQTV